MTFEKLQLLVTSLIEPTQKVTWLSGGTQSVLLGRIYDVSKINFTHWLHYATFWAQINHGFEVLIAIIAFFFRINVDYLKFSHVCFLLKQVMVAVKKDKLTMGLKFAPQCQEWRFSQLMNTLCISDKRCGKIVSTKNSMALSNWLGFKKIINGLNNLGPCKYSNELCACLYILCTFPYWGLI